MNEHKQAAIADQEIQMRREAIRMAYRNLFSGWLISPICSLTFVALLWRWPVPVPLLWWFGASVALPAIRLAGHLKFNAVSEGEFDVAKWGFAFNAGAASSGLLWGSAAIFIFPFDSIPNQNFLLLLIAGLAAGASMSYSPLKWASMLFAAPAFLPPIVRLFTMGDSLHNAMAFVATAFALAVYGTSRNAYSLVLESLRLRHENVGLIGGLQEARERQAHDIVELRNAKDEAEEATKLKDKFLTIVSHDLKGPLGIVRGFMSLSLRPDSKPEEMRNIAGRSYKILDDMLGMIDQLLDIGRIKTGQMHIQKYRFSAWVCAEASIQKLRPVAEEKGVAIRNDLRRDATLFADAALIDRVFTNLLSNAIKFTPHGGVVTVFRPAPGAVAIRDTGVGIDEKILPDLFRHEVKTSGVGTAGETGTGLGLPFCQDIMRAHGGALRVETGRGGTTIFLELPGESPTNLVG
jgi:signal transduction histidine kinase